MHHLVSQRLSEQHRAALISFVASVFYEQGKSVTLGSIEEFASYSEITQERAISLQVEWTFLVDLPGTELPQKQVIRCWFAVEKRSKTADSTALDRIFLSHRIFQLSVAYKAFEVEHTHVTLGNDLSNLLASEFDKKSEKSFARKLTTNSFFIGGAVGSLTAILWCGGLILISRPFSEAYYSDSTVEELVQSGKLTVSMFLAGLVGIALSFLSFKLALTVIDKLTENRPSFIVLSERARAKSVGLLSAFERRALIRLWFGGVALVSATVSGVLSAKVLDFL